MISIRIMALLSTALQSSPHVMAYALPPMKRKQTLDDFQRRLGV